MARPKEITDEHILQVARRCLIESGSGVSAVDIAREVGVSHTTLFNRFGSKEGLMIAALGPSPKVPWAAALDSGPDDRPIRDQLIEHGKVMAEYFETLQAGLSVLNAAGISSDALFGKLDEDPPPMQAFRALIHWLRRAQDQGRLADCDVDTLATTLLVALHSRAITACFRAVENQQNNGQYVERFIDLLWNGIGLPQSTTRRSL